MVAMMNKNLIQSTVNLPLTGETNFFSKSLRFNLELIFFRKLFSDILSTREQKKNVNELIKMIVDLFLNFIWLQAAHGQCLTTGI